MSYDTFLASKAYGPVQSGIEAQDMHPSLYPFQQAVTRWAVRRGRAAIFADCGLGKTRMQVEWARQMGGPALIVAPLAVAEQTIAEAASLEYMVARAEDGIAPIAIVNYERLHKLNPTEWNAIVLDESSILKSVDGKTRTKLLNDWTGVPYRLCCTATPAPNDIAELANHAEFLGAMTRPEMLATFFVHEERDWRLKGHAEDAFWQWLSTWAVYLRKPSDIGFEDEGFDLPALRLHEVSVKVEDAPANGELFPSLARGITGRTAARRNSLAARLESALGTIRGTDDQVLVWCGLNAEQDALAADLGSECVTIDGSTPEAEKLAREQRWRRGEVRVLLTKPSVFGWGMNWQHCHRMVFVGLGDSYEQYYQSIRRCWRFGQTQPVDVTIVVSEAEGAVVQNVRRKERDAERTADRVIAHMRDLETAAVKGETRMTQVYETDETVGHGWTMMLGDSAERLKLIDTGAVGFSVYSPPFASLYTYSASERDLGNSRSYEEFFEHFRYIVAEVLRVTMPGRRTAVHVQQVTTAKATHGVIGWRDFRADTVAAYQQAGWVYDGEVVIDKDPQAQAIRTKSKALMFATKERDSAWLRPAMADYILLFRAPGENPEPIHPDVSNEEWILWARPIWYGIRETETLQAASAREDKDEKHIAPLQLETIERCIRLWSNPGDLILSPFAGIGSEGYVSVQHGRRFIGCELKPSYYRQACRNLEVAEASKEDLFSLAANADNVPQETTA